MLQKLTFMINHTSGLTSGFSDVHPNVHFVQQLLKALMIGSSNVTIQIAPTTITAPPICKIKCFVLNCPKGSPGAQLAKHPKFITSEGKSPPPPQLAEMVKFVQCVS